MDKEELEGKARATLKDLGNQIKELEGKIDHMGADAQDKAKEELEELKKEESKLENLVDKIEDAVEDEWDDLKERIQASSKDFKAGFKKLFGG